MREAPPSDSASPPDVAAAVAPRRRRRWLRRLLAIGTVVFAAGLIWPETVVMPVAGASARDWHPQSFWYEPWGASGVHKGIDIFAPKGRAVRSTTPGIVLFRGELARGGKVVAVLGPQWRLHYYAHLNQSSTTPLALLAAGAPIGEVGDSGNAAGKPPHLHYTVLSLLPRPWQATRQTQGWKRMFFVDPQTLLQRAGAVP